MSDKVEGSPSPLRNHTRLLRECAHQSCPKFYVLYLVSIDPLKYYFGTVP